MGVSGSPRTGREAWRVARGVRRGVVVRASGLHAGGRVTANSEHTDGQAPQVLLNARAEDDVAAAAAAMTNNLAGVTGAWNSAAE